MAGRRIQSSLIERPVSGSSNNNNSDKDQDKFLPIANVSRIMKKSLPANAKISKEAKETVQECLSEFISFITGEASDKCQREKRKTINGDDLLWAMTTLGFENYVVPLKAYLSKYRETEEEKNTISRQDDHASSSPINDGENVAKVTIASLNASGDHSQTFNSGYIYDLNSQVSNHSRVSGYGEDLVSNGAVFNIGKAYEFDGNVKRALAANLHHGVGW